jgi:hypothetical protein
MGKQKHKIDRLLGGLAFNLGWLEWGQRSMNSLIEYQRASRGGGNDRAQTKEYLYMHCPDCRHEWMIPLDDDAFRRTRLRLLDVFLRRAQTVLGEYQAAEVILSEWLLENP